MGDPLLDAGATIACPHGGAAVVAENGARATLGGAPALTVAHSLAIVGCPLVSAAGEPQPCVAVRWLTTAARVRMIGEAALLATSTGVCVSASGEAQGEATVAAAQTRAIGV